MREPLVGRKLQALGIDHEEFHLVRGRLEEQAADERVEEDAFPRARRPRDEQVGHPDEIGDHGHPRDVLAQRDGKPVFGLGEGLVVDGVPEVDGVALGVGDLDPDGGLAGDGRDDAHARRLEGKGQIVGEIGDLVDLHARRGLELVHGDDGPRLDLRDLALDAEVGELLFQEPGIGDQVFAPLLRVPAGHIVEQGERRKHVIPLRLGELEEGLLDLLLSRSLRRRGLLLADHGGRPLLGLFGAPPRSSISSSFR